MITATVRYQLPAHIDYAACRAHFHNIAPGFGHVKGLISKHFIWSENGWAGGVYQWETRVLRGVCADRQRTWSRGALRGPRPPNYTDPLKWARRAYFASGGFSAGFSAKACRKSAAWSRHPR